MFFPTSLLTLILAVLLTNSVVSGLPSRTQAQAQNERDRESRERYHHGGGAAHYGYTYGDNFLASAPSASASGSFRRNVKRTPLVPTLPLGSKNDLARCPARMMACPLTNTNSVSDSIATTSKEADYECISYLEDLYSCGGCSTLGTGQDCTAIPSALSVSCQMGACQVHSCAKGSRLSPDGKGCEAISSFVDQS